MEISNKEDIGQSPAPVGKLLYLFGPFWADAIFVLNTKNIDIRIVYFIAINVLTNIDLK